MSLTPAQSRAIATEGNILLVAGAGTGKTRTLVERCLKYLLDPASKVDLPEILIVTFTEAAAAEMRRRLREGLQEQAAANSGHNRAAQQLALFETAHIGTLHGFCLELARRHFYLLELDPQFAVMSEEEAHLLANEQLDALLADYYAEKSSRGDAVRELIATQGDGSDQSIRALIQRLHEYSQALPDPEGWIDDQRAKLSTKDPVEWRDWLAKAFADFKREWLPRLSRLGSNGIAQAAATLVEAMPEQPDAATFAALLATSENCPRGKKGAWLGPLDDFYTDARYLLSLLPKQPGSDPLAEDWRWVSSRMRTLLDLAAEFTERFSRAKRELALADFHDLEQFALRLLWDNKAGAPTKIAEQWRESFKHVLVDEYQDINAAQDQILTALSRDGEKGNRLLVGDVKQSIYRFRLAAPHIFQRYADQWNNGNGTVIRLNENFRSREHVLEFINSFFNLLMVRDVGGIHYEQGESLELGAPDERKSLAAGPDGGPRVELHLRVKQRANGNANGNGDGEPASNDTTDSLAELEEAAKEAQLVANRLRELHTTKHPVWDETLKDFRPVEWRDMAVLLRARSSKVEFYVREFSRLNVPLAASGGRFYETTEISDLLSLLEILDNPLQDLPVLATLRSPIVGLSLDEMAGIRMVAPGTFWYALLRWHDQSGDSAAHQKVKRFLERFHRWRVFTRQMALSACVEEILAETRYSEWLLTQTRGEERLSNLQGFVNLTRQFDRFQRQGLLRFLIFVEAQREAESEPPIPPVVDENAVRLMSIHQSKGLEFPVVVLADTGKNFNDQDLRAEIILNDEYGICPVIKPPNSAKRYPSLPYWLAQREERRELLGEELRVLYVGMTRARDTLILTASVTERAIEKRWNRGDEAPSDPIGSAKSVADWLAHWFVTHAQVGGASEGDIVVGGRTLTKWFLHHDIVLATPPSNEAEAKPPLPAFLTDPAQVAALKEKLAWSYPFLSASVQPAKASVSQLRREAASGAEETARYFQRPAGRSRADKAADAGTATHEFLQRVSLANTGSEAALRAEAAKMAAQKVLLQEDAKLINFANVARFWNSCLGKTVRSQSAHVHRELPFTFKLRLSEFDSILGSSRSDAAPSDDFVIVQGIADLVILLPNSIQILDFKTDHVFGEALAARSKQYAPQLKLYALALSRIYKRPVSASWLYFLSVGEAVEVQTIS